MDKKEIDWMKITYKSYHRSYEVLKKVTNHGNIIDRKQINTDTWFPVMWENLLLTLATEIAMKTLVLQETWELIQDHNLKRLFDYLPEITKNHIKTSLVKYGLPENEFDVFVTERSNDFITRRYAYELIKDSPKSYPNFHEYLYKEIDKLIK